MLNSKETAVKALIQASVVAAVALFVLLLLYAAEMFLVVFAGVLLAVLFNAMSMWIAKKTGLSEKWSTPIALIAPFLLIGIFIWFIAPDVSSQATELADRVPKAARELEQRLLQYQWTSWIMDRQEQVQQALPSGSRALDIAGRFFTTTFGALGNLVLALALGIFFSATPHLYASGIIRLVPVPKRQRASEVLESTRSTLVYWLSAKLIEMAVIGVLTTIGLWLIGIDLALVLGIIAALLSFIPNFGPVISIIPALLIALVSGLDKVLYVIALYAGVQTLESYVLTPILQKKMVDMPPALTISVQVLFGFLVGALGIILATPLAAAVMVMTRMLYVEDALGDRSAEQ